MSFGRLTVLRLLISCISFQLLFLPSVFTADRSTITPTTDQKFIEEYRIGGNDLLEITVYEEKELTQEVRVTSNGYISYPLLGRIKVAGMSVMELEDYIRATLAKDYIRDPYVQISVKEFSNVYVLGQVKQPGPYLFKGGMTVLQAITSAGGFTKIASQHKVRVVRTHGKEREIIRVNAGDIMNGNKEDIVLQPGDTVVVPESFF